MYSSSRRKWRERVERSCNISSSSFQKHIACKSRTPGLPRVRQLSNSHNPVATTTIITLQISTMMTSKSWRNKSLKEAQLHQRLTSFLVSLIMMIRKMANITTLMEQRKVGKEKLVDPNSITVPWRTTVCSQHSNLSCETIQDQRTTTSITMHSTSTIQMKTSSGKMSNKLSSTWLMQAMCSAQYAWNHCQRCWLLVLQNAGISIAGHVCCSTSHTTKTPRGHGSGAPCATTPSTKTRWRPFTSTRATTTRWARRSPFTSWYAPRATLLYETKQQVVMVGAQSL